MYLLLELNISDFTEIAMLSLIGIADWNNF